MCNSDKIGTTSPRSANLSHLRERLNAFRDSSSGSSTPRTTPPPSTQAPSSPEGSPNRWRIAARSSEQQAAAEKTSTATTKEAPPLHLDLHPSLSPSPAASPRYHYTRTRQPVASNAAPSRPNAQARQQQQQPQQQTPPKPKLSVSIATTPPSPSTTMSSPRQRSAPPSTRPLPRSPSWEEQLGALDRLSRQLSLTEKQLDAGPETAPKPVLRPRRSATEHWKKFQSLAVQLEAMEVLLRTD